MPNKEFNGKYGSLRDNGVKFGKTAVYFCSLGLSKGNSMPLWPFGMQNVIFNDFISLNAIKHSVEDHKGPCSPSGGHHRPLKCIKDDLGHQVY